MVLHIRQHRHQRLILPNCAISTSTRMILQRANKNISCNEGDKKNYANRHGLGPRKCLRSCRRAPKDVSLFLGTAGLTVIVVLLISLASRADAFVLPAVTVPSPISCDTKSSATSTVIRSETEQQEETPPSSPSSIGNISIPEVTYRIRDCQYRELTSVAKLVVESFYDTQKINLVARKLYQLAETNRLQQNFPYPESRSVHRMLVIEASKEEERDNEDDVEPTIVGFCDIDARPCVTKLKIPRPYLSDLAIDPSHRRRGLARLLIEASEEFVQNLNSDSKKPPFEELWIRVASDNDAALGLYRDKLGYTITDWSTGEEEKNAGNNEPEIFMLRKDFRK